jgi:hypothetical protein
VYQNPKSSEIQIKISDSYTTKIGVELMNSLGQIIETKSTESNEITIPTNSLSKGVYLVRIFSNMTSKTCKIILQ